MFFDEGVEFGFAGKSSLAVESSAAVADDFEVFEGEDVFVGEDEVFVFFADFLHERVCFVVAVENECGLAKFCDFAKDGFEVLFEDGEVSCADNKVRVVFFDFCLDFFIGRDARVQVGEGKEFHRISFRSSSFVLSRMAVFTLPIFFLMIDLLMVKSLSALILLRKWMFPSTRFFCSIMIE